MNLRMSSWSSLDPWGIHTAKGHDIPFERERTIDPGVQYNGWISHYSILNITPGVEKKNHKCGIRSRTS
jgi:hypothetical protein